MLETRGAVMTYTKEDVQTHYGSDRPAVNVKVRNWPFWKDVDFDYLAREFDAPGFSEEWIEQYLSEDTVESYFWSTCEFEWEMVEQDAQEIFDSYNVTVEADGRSGGWAVVLGLPGIEEWDAVLLAKWRKFEKYARQTADDIPTQMAGSIALNAYPAWRTAFVCSFGDVLDAT